MRTVKILDEEDFALLDIIDWLKRRMDSWILYPFMGKGGPKYWAVRNEHRGLYSGGYISFQELMARIKFLERLDPDWKTIEDHRGPSSETTV